MSTAALGTASRALLKIRDDKLRRCWWCGEWAYALDPCSTCTAPADVLNATSAAAWASGR